MDFIQLKKYILDNNKVEFVLESIGCHHIRYNKKSNKDDYISAANPDGDNRNAITVYLSEYLYTVNYTRNIQFDKDRDPDLLDLVQFVLKKKNNKHKLRDTIVYLHKLLNLKLDFKSSKKKKEESNKAHPLDIFRKIKRKKHNVAELDLYGEEIFNDIVQMPHISLIKEDGIMPWTCKEFRIGYSPYRKRVCFPERYWCGNDNQYLGIMGRTVIPEWELLDLQKYLPITKEYNKGMNLYGLYENYDYIQEAKQVVVLEGQKGVLRRHSRNDKTCVALGNRVITDEQKRILISLDVDIVIALDEGIDINIIRAECEKFYNIRNVYYLYDKWGLLGEKDSPADLEDKLYKFMLKFKVKYDKIEHEKYLKWKKER